MERHHVLVIEDNDDDRGLLERLLERLPEVATVTSASRLADGLALLGRTHSADVVLLDLGLPDSQGIETLTTLREQAPHVAVIVVTGADEDELGDASVRAGAQDFVSKWDLGRVDLARMLRYAAARHDTSNRLRQAIVELQAFAQVVAHDLRGPLATASGWVDLLQHRDDLTPDAARLAGKLGTSIDRMSTLVLDVLQWATAAEREPHRETVGLDALLDAIVENHEPGDVVRPESLPTVVSDHRLLLQVLTNLVDNAVRYGTRAHVTAEVVAGPRLVVQVDDEGPGINLDQRQFVFEPFRRGTASAGTIGTGMGLAIVRRALDRLGGSVRATSSPGGGARLVVSVPVGLPEDVPVPLATGTA